MTFDFALKEDQDMIRQLVQRMATERLKPQAHQWDTDSTIARAQYDQLADSGMLMMTLPETHGGFGLDPLSIALCLEAIASADAGLALTVLRHNALAVPAILSEQHHFGAERWISKLTNNEVLLSYTGQAKVPTCDIEDIDHEGMTLNGTKACVIGGQQADAHVLICTHHGDPTLLVLPSTTEQLEAIPRTLLGFHSAGIVDLDFDDVDVEPEHVLTLDHSKHPISMTTMKLGLISVALGIAKSAYDEAVSYAVERKQFGKRLIDFQVTQFKLANMATDLEASRMLMLGAADAVAQEASNTDRLLKLASNRANQCAVNISDEALQLHGGYGYTKEYPVERLYRDARTLPLWHKQL